MDRLRAAALPVAGAAALAFVLTSCSKPPEPAKAAAFDIGLPLSEVMEHVIQSSANRFWAGSGTVYDTAGAHSRKPTTPEGWQSVEDGAAGVIEGGNLLLLPGRAREPEADWNRRTLELMAAGKAALAAAQSRDEPAMMEVGTRLYAVCEGCHERYMTLAQRGLEPAPAKAAATPATPAPR